MGHEKFPSDLDLDIFNGSLECDMESIIRSELMDADGLDFNFDSLISAQNVVSLNVGNFTGAKQASSQSWVPGWRIFEDRENGQTGQCPVDVVKCLVLLEFAPTT